LAGSRKEIVNKRLDKYGLVSLNSGIMITVYKYQIYLDDVFELNLPKDAKILTAQAQGQNYFLWALVDTDAEKEKLLFRFAGTGHEIEKEIVHKLQHVNSFQDGSFVWHLFEVLSFKAVIAKSLKTGIF
jgi:hypothetical protein